MKIVSIGVRYIILELSNNYPYYNNEELAVYVDDILYTKTNKNVISIYDLKPNTLYNIKIGSEEINVKTLDETICIHTDMFHPYKDGINNDTIFIQQAILACPSGGTVYIDKGLYLITSLFLKSDITIYLDKEAKLICEYDRSKFPVLKGNIKNGENELNLGCFEGSEQDVFSSFITGINIKNCTLVGLGEIDGRADLGDWFIKYNEIRIAARPFGIYLNRCENITLAGFYIHDTPCWNIHPYFSNKVNILDLRIENPIDKPTTDGIDPDTCSDMLILGCYFKVGDDCIAIKSGTIDFAKKYLSPSRNIVIRNCLMTEGHGGVVFGSESSGGINNVVVSQTYFKNTDRGLRIKTRRGRGRYGKISNITFDNIKMENVLTPFVVNMFYNMGPKPGHDEYFWTREKQIVDETTPLIEDFTFSNIICFNAQYAGGVFLGLPEETIKKIHFKNVSFMFDKNATPGYPVMIEHKEKMLRKGLYLENVDELVLDNVKFLDNIGDDIISDNKTKIKIIK